MGIYSEPQKAQIKTGYLYGHSQVTLCCDPFLGTDADAIWIFGGVEGTSIFQKAVNATKFIILTRKNFIRLFMQENRKYLLM